MEKEELIKKIISKKEFSRLPLEDVRRVFKKFDQQNFSDEEKIKLTRDLLRKMHTVFLSTKLLKYKEKNFEWFLKKHFSTKERFKNYEKLYERIFANFEGKLNLYDLGCGVNAFSSVFFPKNLEINYFGVEAVGQLVEIQKKFFEGRKSFHFFHKSLFNLNGIKRITEKDEGRKVLFLFKVLDSLEMLEKDYSKTLLREIVPLADLVVVSFATRSLVSKRKFFAKRKWLKEFIEKDFKVIEIFEEGNEEYILFSKKGL